MSLVFWLKCLYRVIHHYSKTLSDQQNKQIKITIENKKCFQITWNRQKLSTGLETRTKYNMFADAHCHVWRAMFFFSHNDLGFNIASIFFPFFSFCINSRWSLIVSSFLVQHLSAEELSLIKTKYWNSQIKTPAFCKWWFFSSNFRYVHMLRYQVWTSICSSQSSIHIVES